MDEDETARLRRAIARLARALNAAAAGEGLTPAQASVLGLVTARGPLTVSRLIELEGLNPSVASRVLGKLDEAGLVRRSPGTDDQRTVRVAATAAGRRMHQRIKIQRNALVSASIVRLPTEQAADLAHALPALEALADHLSAQT